MLSFLLLSYALLPTSRVPLFVCLSITFLNLLCRLFVCDLQTSFVFFQCCVFFSPPSLPSFPCSLSPLRHFWNCPAWHFISSALKKSYNRIFQENCLQSWVGIQRFDCHLYRYFWFFPFVTDRYFLFIWNWTRAFSPLFLSRRSSPLTLWAESDSCSLPHRTCHRFCFLQGSWVFDPSAVSLSAPWVPPGSSTSSLLGVYHCCVWKGLNPLVLFVWF